MAGRISKKGDRFPRRTRMSKGWRNAIARREALVEGQAVSDQDNCPNIGEPALQAEAEAAQARMRERGEL